MTHFGNGDIPNRTAA